MCYDNCHEGFDPHVRVRVGAVPCRLTLSARWSLEIQIDTYHLQ